jgi:hypothetical protein
VTVDDLVKVYCDAFYAQRDKAPEKGITEADRAGVTAIVRALRDEIVSRTARNTLDQILGDAGEKVAGGLPDDAVPIPLMRPESAISAPATDAAPAVCVWTGEEYVTYSTSCESEHEVDPHKAPPTYCPSCGKPIAFTEAK